MTTRYPACGEYFVMMKYGVVIRGHCTLYRGHDGPCDIASSVLARKINEMEAIRKASLERTESVR